MSLRGYTKYTTARWKRTLNSLEKFNESLLANYGEYLKQKLYEEIRNTHEGYDFGNEFPSNGVLDTGYMLSKWNIQVVKEGKKTKVLVANSDPKAEKVEFGFEGSDFNNTKPTDIVSWLYRREKDGADFVPKSKKEKYRMAHAIIGNLKNEGYPPRPVLRVSLDNLKRYNKEFVSLDFDDRYIRNLMEEPMSNYD